MAEHSTNSTGMRLAAKVNLVPGLVRVTGLQPCSSPERAPTRVIVRVFLAKDKQKIMVIHKITATNMVL